MALKKLQWLCGVEEPYLPFWPHKPPIYKHGFWAHLAPFLHSWFSRSRFQLEVEVVAEDSRSQRGYGVDVPATAREKPFPNLDHKKTSIEDL